MRIEFIEAFDQLFQNGFKRLNRTLKIKLAAMKYAKHFLKQDDMGLMNQSMRTFNGKSIYDKKFRNIHKLFYSRSDHGIRYTVDAVPDNY